MSEKELLAKIAANFQRRSTQAAFEENARIRCYPRLLP